MVGARDIFHWAPFAGDSASTRRLTEVIQAGCVPTFVGPPFHARPFEAYVDYAALGVIVRIANSSSWLADPDSWMWQVDSPDKVDATQIRSDIRSWGFITANIRSCPW